MYSKAEMQQLKREFWTAFADAYPQKWLLYDTKIKDVSLKFHAQGKQAQVMLTIESRDDDRRYAYFDKMLSLQTLLKQDYLPDALLEKDVYLENKVISKVWVEFNGFSINNRAHWPTIFDFFAQNMTQFELFFYEFEDYIKDI
ncbi:MAG TPA: DUF4268 domain-containing protein [Flavobacterium sp.]|nr:DUF4268 domain-containing protein [Flavobacterium sp.]